MTITGVLGKQSIEHSIVDTILGHKTSAMLYIKQADCNNRTAQMVKFLNCSIFLGKSDMSE